MIDRELAKQIESVEAIVRETEKFVGPYSIELADNLEICASLLRKAGIRGADASEMEEKAKAIRSRATVEGTSSGLSNMGCGICPRCGEAVTEKDKFCRFCTKICKFCAEKIKIEARFCRFCKRDQLDELLDPQVEKAAKVERLRSAIGRMNFSEAVSLLPSGEVVAFQTEFDRQRKHVGIAYLLLVLLGSLGGHKFYLGDFGWGMLYLGWIPLLLVPPLWLGYGIIVGILLFFDLLLLPGQVGRANDVVRQQILTEIVNRIQPDKRAMGFAPFLIPVLAPLVFVLLVGAVCLVMNLYSKWGASAIDRRAAKPSVISFSGEWGDVGAGGGFFLFLKQTDKSLAGWYCVDTPTNSEAMLNAGDPAISGTVGSESAQVTFRSASGGTGKATLTLQGDKLMWTVAEGVTAHSKNSSLPTEATLVPNLAPTPSYWSDSLRRLDEGADASN